MANVLDINILILRYIDKLEEIIVIYDYFDWLRRYKTYISVDKLLFKVIKYDKIKFVYAIEKHYPKYFSKYTGKYFYSFSLMIKNDCFDMFTYLHTKYKINVDQWTFKDAADNGRLRFLKYLHQKNCPSNQKATLYASENNHIECLKWLHQNNYELHPKSVMYCIEKNSCETLRYILESYSSERFYMREYEKLAIQYKRYKIVQIIRELKNNLST